VVTKQPRPSVVTLAGVFIAITAFLSLTELTSALTYWATVEMQDQLKPALRQLDAAGFEMTMTELLRILRWVGLGMIPLLVAALVCSIYALRGDRASRVAATALAVGAGVISLPLGVFGLLQATMLFIAAAALWSPDANRWYRGEPATKAKAPATAPVEPAVTAAPPPDDPAQAAPVAPAAPTAQPAGSRPTSVVTAGVVAIAGSFLAAGMAVIYLLVYTFQREAQIEAVLNGPFGEHFARADLEAGMRFAYWVFWAVLPLATTGLLGGIALLARLRIGRPALMFWAWASALVGLLMLPLGLLAIAAAVAVIVLLRRDDVRSWLSAL
jgi:hypothetical protein